MKNSLLTLFLILFTFSAFSQTEPAGTWNTGDENTIVKITEQDGVYIGKIVSTDKKKTEAGSLMIKDLKFKKGKWEGQIRPPNMGWKDAEFNRIGGILKVKVSVAFISKKFEWKKIE